MIHPVSKLYEGASLTRTTLQLMFLRAPTSGTIKSVYIYTSSNIAVGTSIFNLRINGAAQWTADNRPSIGAGNSAASKTGLNIAVTRGNVIYLDLEQSAQSGTPAPLCLVVEIDDGVSAGADSADEISVDDSGFSNIEGGDVQEILADIDAKIDSGGSGGQLDGLFPITAPGEVADFSWLNQNAATASTRGNAILLKETVSVSLSLPMLVKTLPSAPHVFTLGFRCWTDLANSNAGAGLVLYESSSGKFITVRFLPSGSTLAQIDLWNSFTSYNSTVLASNPPEFSKLKDFIFVRVRDTGTTRYYETSYDGDEWRSMFSHATGTFITPDKAGFFLAQQSGDAGGMTVISFSIE